VTRVAHYVERWLDLSAGFVAEHVARSRHRHVVISRDGWENLAAFPARPRVSLHHLRDRVPERAKANVLRLELAATLTAYQCSLVHVHFGYAARDVVPHLRRRRFVLSLHGHDATALAKADPARYAEVAPVTDAVVVPSMALARDAEKAGFDPARLHVIPAGVDTDFFTATPLPDGAPTVAFVGRFVPKKGLDVLLDAWPAIRSETPGAQLLLLGSGPLEHLIPEDPSIRRIPPQPNRRRAQVREVLRSATVVATPSHTSPDGDKESLLLVNLEAGASGRPVVSTRHGGIPEYVEDGRTGLLVDEAEPDAFATAVIQVLNDRDLATSLGRKAVDHVAQWDVRRCTARVDELYDSLLAKP